MTPKTKGEKGEKGEGPLQLRQYVDGRGERTDELVLVDVDNSEEKQPRRLCAPAQWLATTAAQRLAS